MKYVGKLIVIILIFVMILPSVQSTNIFQDIKSIDKGMKEANSKLEAVRAILDDLVDSINDTNSIMEDVEESASLLDNINTELEDLNTRLDDVSDKATDALDTVDKVDIYVGSLMTILWVGVGLIAVALLVLIAVAIVIIKRRK